MSGRGRARGALLGRLETALFSGPKLVAAGALLLVLNIWTASVLVGPFLTAVGGPDATARVPDFVAFWGAGQLAATGDGADAYDPARLHTVQEAGLGWQTTLMMEWLHPPPALFLASPLGWTPVALGFYLWLGLGMAALMGVAWRIHPHPAMPLFAAAVLPSVHATALGQMSFWFAGFFGAGLLAMVKGGRTQEIRSGLWFALLSVKPHLAILLPVGLAAAGRWLVLIAGATGCLAIMLASALVFGPESWMGFWVKLTGAVDRFEGSAGRIDWAQYLSVYGALRASGVGFAYAIALHGAQALAATVALVVICRRPAAAPALVAALIAYVSVLAIPRMFLYDATILVIGVAFQCRHAIASGGYMPGERSIIAVATVAGTAGVFHYGPWCSALPVMLFWACWLAGLRRLAQRR